MVAFPFTQILFEKLMGSSLPASNGLADQAFLCQFYIFLNYVFGNQTSRKELLDSNIRANRSLSFWLATNHLEEKNSKFNEFLFLIFFSFFTVCWPLSIPLDMSMENSLLIFADDSAANMF